MYSRKIIILTTFAFAFGFGVPRTDAQKMYWTVPGSFGAPGTGDGKIQRANLDGSDIEDLLTGLISPQGIAIDLASEKIYWTEGVGDAVNDDRKIRRANLDGTALEDVVTAGFFPGIFGRVPPLRAVAVDSAGGKIYWSAGHIQRANLDGSGVEDIIDEGLDGFLVIATGIALNPTNAKLYWTYATDYVVEPGFSSLRRSSLDGSDMDIVIDQLISPGALALDVAGRKVYWSDFGSNARPDRIQRANLNGTGIEDLVLGDASGMALDLAAGKIYLVSFGGRIKRANLDGSDIEDLLTPGLAGFLGARDIALDVAPPPPPGFPTASAWGMAVLLMALLAGIALKFRRSRAT